MAEYMRAWYTKKKMERLAAVANNNPEALQQLQSRIEEVQSKEPTASDHNAFVEAYNEKVSENYTNPNSIIPELIKSALYIPNPDSSQEERDEAARLREALEKLVVPDESTEEQKKMGG